MGGRSRSCARKGQPVWSIPSTRKDKSPKRDRENLLLSEGEGENEERGEGRSLFKLEGGAARESVTYPDGVKGEDSYLETEAA